MRVRRARALARVALIAILVLVPPVASLSARTVPPPRAPDVSPARQQAAIDRFTGYGLPVYCGGGRKRLVALTFDDGPSELTPQLLGALRAADARATFFVIGAKLRSPRLARYLRWEAARGALGDHTWSHALLTRLSSAQVAFQIETAKREVSGAAHAPVDLFRPPYDERDREIDRTVRSLGLVEVLWNVDPRDWATSDWREIGDRVLADLRPGAIVVLHENRPQTLTAVREAILPALARNHLKAVTVPELLALDPPTLSQLRRGFGGCRR